MADKSISELVSATTVQSSDFFVLQQNNTAKKLDGQTLINFLLNQIDGHGGIQRIQKIQTSGLVDTYQITFADSEYTVNFTVTNGKGITGISKTGTSGLVDTYKISYNDGSSTTFNVTNGAKGDKGDNAYVWIKYASQKPTSSSSSMGDEPDDWMGVYSGTKSTAPTDPMEYKWSLTKGEKGDTGNPATIVTNKTEYQVSDSGTIIPSGVWSTSIPVVTPGKYLWARTTTQFNSGSANYAYSISRFGIDGSGSVVTVNDVSPDENGNVELTAEQLQCLGLAGGTMTGPIHMNGQKLTGLNDPTAADEAARKAYVDNSVREAAPVNLLDNSDFRHPVAQAGVGGSHGNQAYALDRWILTSGTVSYQSGIGLTLNGTITQKLEHPPTGTVSAFVGMASGQASISYSGGAVTITSAGGVIAWAALYQGTYTEETKPEYHPKGYSIELAACLRVFRRIELYGNTGVVLSDGSSAAFYIGITPMLITPTVIVEQADNLVTYDYNQSGFAARGVTGASTVPGIPTSIVLTFDTSSGKLPIYSAVTPLSTIVQLSADLG